MSVCLPTYDMGGVGHIFLRHSLNILTQQTFNDFDVVISDYSKTDQVKSVVAEFHDRLDIKYFKNEDPTGGMAANTNNAIRHATGTILKILFQDDFLYDRGSLEVVAKNFDLAHDRWLVTACEHSRDGTTFFRPFYPTYNDRILYGNNTISSPSVLTIKNECPLLFDPKLKWLVDCDYYQRCHDLFGPPKIVNTIAVVNRVGEHQITNTEATEAVRQNELRYVKEKFRNQSKIRLRLPSVTVVAVTGIGTEGALKALEYSIDGIAFREAVLIAHHRPEYLDPRITFRQCQPDELVSQDRKNTNDYSRFMAYSLHKYVFTDYVLIVHNDAYVLRPEKWDPDFLRYDYVGAPWPEDVHFTTDGTNVRVGNGGFSLRSAKLLRALNELHLPFTDNGTGYFHEDGIICVYYRKQLENYGITYAPVPLAAKFSLETECPESDFEPFGFHNTKKAIPKYFFLRKRIRRVLKLR